MRKRTKVSSDIEALVHQVREGDDLNPRDEAKRKLRRARSLLPGEEFQKKLDKIPALKTAFKALTPGRQRAYIFYFSQPKQSKTRESRVEKYMKQILNGKGLND